jgi:transglutaminase-like putative cysteine protease
VTAGPGPAVRRPKRNPDRVDLPWWLLGSLVAATSLAAGVAGQMAARARVGPATGFGAGVLVAVLAVLGLPSVSIRLAARAVLGLSTVVLVRYGILGGTLTTGGQSLVAWLVAASAVLVLTDRVGTVANPSLDAGGADRRALAGTARSLVTVALIVVLLALLIAPLIAPHLGRPTAAGTGPQLDPAKASRALQASESLDMTTRPDLTDEVVFTVESNRATFWRGETFDAWDGRHWTRTRRSVRLLGPDGAVAHEPDDLGASGDDVVHQRIRIEADFADVLYAAASATSVDTEKGVAQRADGTLLSVPLGRGATYRVTSRRQAVSVADLRAATGPVPADVAARYARDTTITGRVEAAARAATRGARTTYDKVVALESWMGNRTEYSLKAPLAPAGVDVVDHFLFVSKRGWCEQIASSLVVMARANGIPARLVTGFVPGEQDPVSGRFTVRARDAHAWAEVWFPKVGWVPFDPTAHVPLAGEDPAQHTWSHWLATHWAYLVLVVLAIVVVVGPVRVLARRLRRRLATAPHSWAARADRELDRLGRRAGRDRRPGETASAFGAALAHCYADDRLAAVGALVDDAVFAPVGPTEEQRAGADAVLAEVAAGPAPPHRDVTDDDDRAADPLVGTGHTRG